jgi:hypothetical protein
MATNSVPAQIDRITASMAGVEAFLADLVQNDDFSLSNQAFAMSDLLKRLQADLDGIALQMRGAN